MGFFKKIGAGIKKVSKKISFNNAIKLASSFDPTGISRGLIDSVEAKKAEKKAIEEQNRAQAEYDKQIAENNAIEAEKQKQLIREAMDKAEYSRQVQALNTQAVGGKIGLAIGSIGGQITQNVVETATENINKDLQTGLAKAGANIANQTFNEWLKIHWWKVLLAVLGLGLVLRLMLRGDKRR
ncbi:hypothetical protein [Flavobacterium sp. UMI-01]|uniref:hypothetical protein n=1 Tax=Flavobacterium sp. UMI-01 TaxID=1441053 RepID=UPI001C7D743E|nr:hypothetical protein [Flavobacterium sp. UMI-01]GIZ08486.1 hypothetical protein FUMI01_12130 [Flavobacterium sp. UMI-01]